MKRWIISTVILGLLLVCSPEGWARTWKSKTGKFSVDAELVEVEDGKAVLKRTDGKIVRVPIEKLSAADRRYLESLNKPAANSATPPNKEQPPKDAASDITAPVAPAGDANPRPATSRSHAAIGGATCQRWEALKLSPN